MAMVGNVKFWWDATLNKLVALVGYSKNELN